MSRVKGNNEGFTLIERVVSWLRLRLKGNNKGFTLIEIITVMGVTSIMAAVLVPMTTAYIGDAKVKAAASDTFTIASAIHEFHKDVKEWPIWATASEAESHTGFYLVLSTDGDNAMLADDDATNFNIGGTEGEMGSLEGQLVTNTPGWARTGKHAWNGPYMESLGDDPWGNKYYVTAQWLQHASFTRDGALEFAAYVLSAGADEIIQTDWSQSRIDGFEPGGDDIVTRIR